MRWNIEDLPPRLQEQARAKLAVRSEDAEPYKTPREEEESAAAVVESDLQAACEAWLVARGYGRRTPKKLQTHHTQRWFIHLARPEGNPILLDLLLLDSRHNRYLEVELKAESGSLTPDQRSLVHRGEGRLAWSLRDFQDIVEGWEEMSATDIA
jgi:hypothetical protein